MADPYRRYLPIERDPRAAVPGYIPSDAPSTASHLMWGTSDSRGTPDISRNDMLPSRSGTYGLDDYARTGSHATARFSGLASGDNGRAFNPSQGPALARPDVPLGITHNAVADGSHATNRLSGLATGDNIRSFSPLESPALARTDIPLGITRNIVADGSHATNRLSGFAAGDKIRAFSPLEGPASARPDVPLGITHNNVADGSHGTNKLTGLAGDNIRSFSPLEDPALARPDVPLGIKQSIVADGLPSEESNILFVDCLPTDCKRREVAHLFRPFIGFKDIRVVHKEPRQTGDKARVLCFVEFDNAKCALTALEAIQGYKFDDEKPEAPVLRIQLVKFPFRPPPLH